MKTLKTINSKRKNTILLFKLAFTRQRFFILILFLLIVSFNSRVLFSLSITKGPYLQNVGKTYITICWETDKESLGKVEYSIYHLSPFKEEGNNKSIEKFLTEARKKSKIHCVELTDLQESRKYIYKIISSTKDEAVMSNEFIFTTAPDFNQPFSFVALGDTRTNHLIHKDIMTKVKKVSPAFILNSGDLIANGNRKEDWEQFFKIINPFISTIPYYPSLGNHEHNSDYYFDYFSLPHNERYYSFNYGNSHFVVLDSNAPFVFEPAQKKWLIKDLESATDAIFKFVMFHHPPYSSSEREENTYIRTSWCPIFEKFGVDIVFNGHDHFYERSFVKTKSSSKENESHNSGIYYIITGGGGAPLYNLVKNNPLSVKKSKEHHFIEIRIEGKNLIARAINLNGEQIDYFEIKK